MKRFMFLVAILVAVAYASTSGAASSKCVTIVPPPTTSYNPTTTQQAPTTTLSTTTSSTTSTTSTRPATLDTPNQPFNIRYASNLVGVLELRWWYNPKTYGTMEVGASTCFYANGVSLCGDGIEHTRDNGDYLSTLTKPQFFGGGFPVCVVLSVRVFLDDGQYSDLMTAPPACIA